MMMKPACLGKNAPATLRAELRLVRALRNLGERQRAYELLERYRDRL